MEKITVLLAEDHTIVRKGLRALLDAADHLEVVGEAADGSEAVRLVKKLLPDVVVMDITMPHLNGLEATWQIKKSFPQVQVLILTMYTNEEYIFQVLKAGASGYLVKQSAPDELLLAIEVVHRGDSFLSPSVSKKLVDEFVRQGEETAVDDSYDNLTVREREVLQLVAEGHTNREIANILHISIKTVGVHRSHLMEKLNIHNVAELIKYAIRKGVIILD